MRGDGLHYRLCHADLATQAFRYQIVSFISVQADARRKTPVQQSLGMIVCQRVLALEFPPIVHMRPVFVAVSFIEMRF